MKQILKSTWLWLAAVALIAAPTLAQAQDAAVEMKTVAVVSIAPFEKVLGDVQYLTEIADHDEIGLTVAMMSAPFTQGIDKSRPVGVVVRTDGQQFNYIGFIPVTNLKALLLILRDQIGEPQDMGDGVFVLEGPLPIYYKEVEGWVFVAQDKESLADVPAKPADLLANLPKDYDLAAKVNLDNIPELFREMLIAQMRNGIELSLEQEQGESDEDFAQRQQMVELQVAQLERMLTEITDLTIGWNVDKEAGKTYVDVAYNVAPGSKIAEQLALNKGVTSDFSGFLSNGSAGTIHISSKIAPEEIGTTVKQLNAGRQKAFMEIEDNPDLDDKSRDAATRLIDLSMDALIETIKAGKIDMGITVDLAPNKMTFLMGAFVADGKRVEDGFKEILKMVEDQPNFPGVKWNADSHQGVAFHVIEGPVPADEEEARKLFGEKLIIVLGIGEKSAYMSIGNDAIAKLKKVIDDSLAGAGQPTTSPATLMVSAKPILEFILSIDESAPIAAALDALGDQNAQLTINGTITDTSATTRINLDSGVIKAIAVAAAVKQAEDEAAAEAEDADN
ncbi:hypothetical protein LOC68_18520 [Blastopirellula sp. JC732]|uniref:Uncharacterized protein n=1 Tax=Blastopirellula sediminis TaxID=2894196 RepID=A0A9X1MNC0_9BACT|nr:hypothetical protein [Blastopirellula sediminis]MCC9606309.1 hypothetical protein [Blastopirellula sediminis]MCC9630393.1 hypothetical protein [Blastopirellula sediminis]